MRIETLIRCDKSTENKPIRFFESFFNSSDKILHARRHFLPDLDSLYNKYPPVYVESVDETNISFTVSYEVINNEADWNDTDWFPNSKWEKETYVFIDELYEYLKRQYNISKGFLEENMRSKLNRYKAKYFLIALVSKCLILLRKIKGNSDFLPTDKHDIHIKAIIRFIYKNYPDFTPRETVEIRDILIEDADFSYFYRPKSLKQDIIKKILKLCDEQTGDLIFDIQTANSTPEIELGYFVSGLLNEMTAPLNFTINIQASYYLIHEIIEKTSPFTAATVARSNMILMKGIPFKESNYSKNALKFAIKNSSKKTEIDTLINSYLK